MDLNLILRDLRENPRIKKRGAIEERPLVRGGKAWRKRKRRQEAEIERELDKLHGRKRAQARYHYKNKETLNLKRAARARTPQYVYRRAYRKALERGQEWEFDFETWYGLWQNAPKVYDKDSGFFNSAWKMKGSNYAKCTQLTRKDTDGPWSEDNCHITLRGEPLQ